MGFYLMLAVVYSRMFEIGLVGLDTSHAESFAEVFEEMEGLSVNAVWDSYDVRDKEYVESFCQTYDASEYAEVESLVPNVDAAMVLTVDWETHAPLASTFLDANIPTMIDKPVAGSQESINHIRGSAQETPLFGGSALPFHHKIDVLPRGGSNRTVFAAGFNDFFYYRVHLTDTIRYLADADWTRVAPSEEPGTTVDVSFENGLHATLRFDGSPEEGTFSLLDVGDRTKVVEIDSGRDALAKMYVPYLEHFESIIAGDSDDSERIYDSSSLLLAVESAIGTNEVITPESPALGSVSIDSSAFVMEYEPYY